MYIRSLYQYIRVHHITMDNHFLQRLAIQRATVDSTIPALEGYYNIEAWRDALWNELESFEVLELIQRDMLEP